MNDHELAGHLAERAGQALIGLRDCAYGSEVEAWELRRQGDELSHEFLVSELAEYRPADSVLSEEGADDRSRLSADRTWIIDPLDGSQDFPYRDSVEWAVHVGLVQGGIASVGAVALPGMARLYETGIDRVPPNGERNRPIVVSSRAQTYIASGVAEALGARLVACGSAGVKAMLVVGGEADVYVHSAGLYEWDACAPAAVAAAVGIVVRDLQGQPILYNKPYPVVEGLVMSRPEYVETVATTLGW